MVWACSGSPGQPCGALFGRLGGLLGRLDATPGVLEHSWAAFGRLAGLLGRLEAIVGAVGALLGHSQELPEPRAPHVEIRRAPPVGLGPWWEARGSNFEASLGLSWALFWSFWGHLEASWGPAGGLGNPLGAEGSKWQFESLLWGPS